MKIVKKDLKLTLEEKNLTLNDLYTGNILTYSGVNHSGSFIGTAIAGPLTLFVKDESGKFRPLTNLLWESYPEKYMTSDDNPTFVQSIVINVKSFKNHLNENCLSTNIKTLKDTFQSLKTLSELDNTRKPH